jgi:hypothetical protein
MNPPTTPQVSDSLDLGHDHMLRYTTWAPDRELNPQYADLPDVKWIGAIIAHRKADGELCEGAIFFDSETARRVFPDKSRWTVESWEPLTLSPSLLCSCGDHGFIREGKWIPA